MEKNDRITAEALASGSQGEGIARVGDTTVFVPYFLPGERADIRILKVKDKIAYGKIEELITPAEERVRPRCPVFFRCGGCQLQHVRYRSQLRLKTGLVQDALKKIAGIEVKAKPCVRSEKEYGYRNKLQLPIGRQNGKNVIGFYAERSHRIVETDECPIHPAWSKDVIAAVHSFMEKCGLDGYDEEEATGQLRHIVVRQLKNKFIVTLVTTVREIKGIDYFLFLLDKIFPEYSFYLNYNPEKTNVVFGSEFTLLKGKGFYESADGGIVYEAGAQTFVQVNDNVRGKLYDEVVACVNEGETVVDCYAGGGLLTALLAEKCGKAIGIELVPEASACADKLMARNGLSGKMKNLCGAVEETLSGVLASEKVDVVVMDPPRAGVDRKVLRLLGESGVGRIVMVSCNPATLARDLGILTGALVESPKGLVKCEGYEPVYEVVRVQPFDMFPQTRHVETLVVLEKSGT